MGNLDGAFALMDKVTVNKSPILLLGFTDPLTSALREDPRYAPLHQRLYAIKETPTKPQKANSSALDDETANAFLSKLTQFVKEESPFLNPALTLRSLAGQLEIHPNQLSWLINEKLGKNFNEYINQLRVERFKLLVADTSNSHISLIGLAYESGFNSKTVFNTTFKKLTGMTPKAYQQGLES